MILKHNHPENKEVFVFLDHRLAGYAGPQATAGRRPASPQRDPPAFDSSILQFFALAVGS
jgi:hypothetical protein